MMRRAILEWTLRPLSLYNVSKGISMSFMSMVKSVMGVYSFKTRFAMKILHG